MIIQDETSMLLHVSLGHHAKGVQHLRAINALSITSESGATTIILTRGPPPAASSHVSTLLSYHARSSKQSMEKRLSDVVIVNAAFPHNSK